MLLRLSRALCGALAILGPALAGAQSLGTSSDSLPFRAGQWGAEFFLRDGTGVTALRFRDADRAWIGTVSGELQRSDAERSEQRRHVATLQFGHRWYQPSARRAVAPFWGLGLGAIVFSDRREVRVGSEGSSPAISDDSSVSLGEGGSTRAEGGRAPRLAVGAAWRVGASGRRTGTGRGSATPASTIYSVRANPVALRATLYF